MQASRSTPLGPSTRRARTACIKPRRTPLPAPFFWCAANGRSLAEPVWWDDLKARVRETAREKAAEFEAQGIKGVDLYISTFGPVLSIISENWPVLTSETDPKTGDPLPLKPGEALDLARQEVVNLRKQGLLLGRSVEFDPVTDWYLMAWDAFKAQEFPADEARKLALALGLDMEKDLVKDKRLVTKKSASVVLCLPADRRKKGMVDEDAETFPHLIDALHTAMMIYDEEGSKACQVFVDRQGLRTDSRTKALVQAMMEAIPTTRDKDGKFLRPEMTTLDALRMLFWDDLPAPKEDEPPKLDPQMKLAGFEEEVEEEEAEEEAADEEEEKGEKGSGGAGERGSREKGRRGERENEFTSRFGKTVGVADASGKAQLLQWVARDIGDAFPGIESTPRICGGEPCIVRTRIPVWVLEQSRRQGISEAELLRSYPTLRARGLGERLGVCTRAPRGHRPADS